MAAVATATELHVPSSLVWVSVPASGSVSSRAPGSLNGLSLLEVKVERRSLFFFSFFKKWRMDVCVATICRADQRNGLESPSSN